MRRLPLPFLLAVAACGPPQEEFAQAYLETWCEAFEQECTTALTYEACRASGTPRDVIPPDPAGCTYDRGAAGACLEVNRWRCEPGDDGRDVLVPPDACADVWTCDGP